MKWIVLMLSLLAAHGQVERTIDDATGTERLRANLRVTNESSFGNIAFYQNRYTDDSRLCNVVINLAVTNYQRPTEFNTITLLMDGQRVTLTDTNGKYHADTSVPSVSTLCRIRESTLLSFCAAKDRRLRLNTTTSDYEFNLSTNEMVRQFGNLLEKSAAK